MKSAAKRYFPVVGIGASAGGLDAFANLMAAMPHGLQVAIVFVQHLSPHHKNLLQEILRRKVPHLDIEEISDGVRIGAGFVYLAPSGKNVGIENDKFIVSAPSEIRPHLPIDLFLISLAREYKDRAVAVILSGAGTDGARGVQAIRENSGTVLVQAPSTAEFTGMPDAAIGTACADQVLSPRSIADELKRITQTMKPVTEIDELSELEQFQRLHELLYTCTGFRFNHYKRNVITRRVMRRMYLHGISTVNEYVHLLEADINEARRLAQDLMIGVTSFFRDPQCWDLLRSAVIRRIVALDTTEPVRIWTPACATGEEAYSVAMLVKHELNLSNKRRELQVFATDINEQALERAREGRYPESVAADIPPEYLRAFFMCSEDSQSLIVSKSLREYIVFAKQDILRDPPFSKLDLIICRNLLIYLEPDAQEKCIDIFHYSLLDKGFLFLGNAETVGRRSEIFKAVDSKRTHIYQRSSAQKISRLPTELPLVNEGAARSVPPPHDTKEFYCEIQESILEKFGPAVVAINKNYEIVYQSGRIEQFIRFPRGPLSSNLFDLLPQNLRTRLRSALFRVMQENVTCSLRATLPKTGASKRMVFLTISRVPERGDLFLVTFEEKQPAGLAAVAEPARNESVSMEDAAVRQLENELSSTRDDLQKHIEQLKSMNEEMRSANEELQASNEEQETSREELQSLNEELITVNSQLQSKIEEQDETNNDLNNFITSTGIPTLFLDEQFNVRRFTPSMTRLIKLIPTDIGRPLADLSQRHLGDNLLTDAQAVLDRLIPVTREMPINDAWFVRTTLPYRTADNRIGGVVITYVDITVRKVAEAELTGQEAKFRAIFENSNDAILLVEFESGRYIDCNPMMQSMSGFTREEICAMKAGGLLPQMLKEDACLNIEKIRAGGVLRGETEILTKDGMLIPVDFNASLLTIGTTPYIVSVLRDMAERKRMEEEIRALARFPSENPNPILRISSKGIILYANEASVPLLKMWGCRAGCEVTKEVRGLMAEVYDERSPRIVEIECDMRTYSFAVVPVVEGGYVNLYGRDITTYKAAEQALRESEKKYRLLFETMTEGFSLDEIILDENGRPCDLRYLLVNPAFERQTGLKAAEVIGKTTMELFPQSEPVWFERYGKVVRSGEPAQFEERFGPLNRWFNVSAFHVGANRFATVFTDITDRKQAEEKLQTILERFYLILSSMHFGILLVTDDNRVEFANQAFCDMFDLRDSPADLMDLSADEMIEKIKRIYIDPDKSVARIDEIVRLGQPVKGEDVGMTGDRTYLRDFVPIRLGEKQFGRLWMHIDITERKKREEEIYKFNRTLKALSRSSHAMIHAREESDYLEEVCSIIVEDCGHAMVWIGFAEEDEYKTVRPAAYAGFEEGYLETLKLSWADTERGRGPTGTAIRTGKVTMCKNMLTDPQFEPWRQEAIKRGYASSIVFPLISGGKPFGALTIYSQQPDPFSGDEVQLLSELTNDLSQGITSNRLRIEVQHRAEELAAANRELESFSYSVAHDLRAPLRVIIGFSDILFEEYAEKLDEEGAGHLMRIKRGAEKLDLLIEDMLALSRINRQEMAREETDLSEIARLIIGDLRRAEPERRIDVVIEDNLKANADTRLMTIALTNLLNNAWKYTRKKADARVEMGSTEQDGRVVFFVKDTGAGFDMKFSDKLFAPFQRLHSESEFPGTGIGLAIVDRVIRRHGGRIWAQSEPDKGATFYFTLE